MLELKLTMGEAQFRGAQVLQQRLVRLQFLKPVNRIAIFSIANRDSECLIELPKHRNSFHTYQPIEWSVDVDLANIVRRWIRSPIWVLHLEDKPNDFPKMFG